MNFWDGDELVGTGSVKNGTNLWSTAISPLEKEGYEFLGWSFEGDDAIYTDLSSVVYGADAQVTEINLYAQWKEAGQITNTYTVTFDDLLASTANPTVEVEEGSLIASDQIPNDPTCEGYTFLGWCTYDAETGIYTPWDFDNDTVTSDITLYAQWEKNEDATNAPGASDENTESPSDPENSSVAEENTSAMPETGDSALPFAAGVAALAGVAGIATAGAALKKRNSLK